MTYILYICMLKYTILLAPRGITMEVSGVVEEMLLPDQSPSTIVLVESSKEVFVECRADIPVV